MLLPHSLLIRFWFFLPDSVDIKFVLITELCIIDRVCYRYPKMQNRCCGNNCCCFLATFGLPSIGLSSQFTTPHVFAIWEHWTNEKTYIDLQPHRKALSIYYTQLFDLNPFLMQQILSAVKNFSFFRFTRLKTFPVLSSKRSRKKTIFERKLIFFVFNTSKFYFINQSHKRNYVLKRLN